MKQIRVIPNGCATGDPTPYAPFGKGPASAARRFHATVPGYHKTPLVSLPALAEGLGIASFSVKDESHRFGLNAFKGLGGSYSVARYLGDRLGLAPDELTFQALCSPAAREKLGTLTFVTATDGNHGRGVAWTCQTLGHRAVVFMPKGSAAERLRNIQALGAQAEITDWNYDDTVSYAARLAEEKGWVLVQDTAWPGYEDIPRWIMEGYTTMALEAAEELSQVPTHIFLQAGVGAMAGAVTAFFRDFYGEDTRPVITIVEPDQADCLFRTAQAADGQIHPVTGDMPTIMAGLACGVPCTIGWDALAQGADFFASVPDAIAAQGMRILGNPMGEDRRIISGESGAATVGFVTQVLRDPALANIRQQLSLDETSRVLCFSTEGDTDVENYRKIVWDGAWSTK